MRVLIRRNGHKSLASNLYAIDLLVVVVAAPVASALAAQEHGQPIIVHASGGWALGAPGAEFTRNFKSAVLARLGIGVPLGENTTIMATFEFGSFFLDQAPYFASHGLSIRGLGQDVNVKIKTVTLHARRSAPLPLGIKGYVIGGPGWMWRDANTLRALLLTCPSSIDAEDLCQGASIPNDAGAVLAFGLGLEFANGKSSRFIVESLYTHGFVADPVTYVPVRFGLDLFF